MQSNLFTFKLGATIPDGDFRDDKARKKWIDNNQSENIFKVIDQAKAHISKHLDDDDSKYDREFLLAVLNFAPTMLGRFNVACNIVQPDIPDPEDLEIPADPTPDKTWLKRRARYYATNLIKSSERGNNVSIKPAGLPPSLLVRGRTDMSEAHASNWANGDLFGGASPMEPENVGRNSKKDPVRQQSIRACATCLPHVVS